MINWIKRLFHRHTWDVIDTRQIKSTVRITGKVTYGVLVKRRCTDPECFKTEHYFDDGNTIRPLSNEFAEHGIRQVDAEEFDNA